MKNKFNIFGAPVFLYKLFRVNEWVSSVLPLVVCAPLYALLDGQTNLSARECLMPFMGFTLFLMLFLCFGYLINDYCDKQDDHAVGKTKLVYNMPDSVVLLMLASLFVLGVSAIISVTGLRFLPIAAVVTTFLVGAAYSIPGIRAKELGVWGLIVSSFAQRGMPLLVAMLVLGMSPTTTLLWLVLVFLDGLRYILIHQIVDLQNDLHQGVKTFAVNHDSALLKSAIVVTLILETLFILPCIVLPAFVAAPIATAIALFVYVFFTGLLYAVFVKVFGRRDVLFSFDLVPLELFLNVFAPCFACLVIAKGCLDYGLGAAAFLALGIAPVLDKYGNLRYVRNLI